MGVLSTPWFCFRSSR